MALAASAMKAAALLRASALPAAEIEILQIDDHGVGAAGHGFVELGAAVGGDEEQ